MHERLNTDGMLINDIHDEALTQHFHDGIGRKAFILSPSFPFLFVGLIKDVVDDQVIVEVETSAVAQLENRTWNIHIHAIEVFYIERDGGPRIPKLTET
ncbi:hypothetical protein LCL95_08760 [Bacillus timonensis]|nr:hypothetical protein [Bacillus timonensis]